LQNEFLAVNRDGVAGVVAAGIARHQVVVFGQDINDLAFALVAPLRTNHHGCLEVAQLIVLGEISGTNDVNVRRSALQIRKCSERGHLEPE
jgi:hypothetical protein